MPKPLWPRLVLAALLALFLWTGVRGLAFGPYWDEPSLANRVKWSIEHGGTLLPGSYDWPSVIYWIGLLALLPDVTGVDPSEQASVTALEQRLLQAADSGAYRQRVRLMLLCLSSLTLLWVYLAAAAWTRSEWAGAVAAGLLGGSWQFAYHARWPSPDALLTQFIALMVLGAVVTRTSPHSPRGPLLAAIAAGMAIGTKYTAWPLALAWFVSHVFWWRAQRRPWLRDAVRRAATIVATFVVTTPGALLQPVLFASALFYLQRHYSADATTLAPYLVGSGWPLLSAALTYLAGVLWSVWLPVALLVSGAIVAGCVEAARRDSTLLWLLAGGPLLLIALMAVQPVMIVRNLLPLAAPLAVAGAMGIWSLAARSGTARRIAVATTAIVIIANTSFLVRASSSIGGPRAAVYSAFLATYGDAMCVSPLLAQSIAAELPGRPVRTCPGEARAQFSYERRLYPPPIVNRPTVLGTLEVDALYYPTWLASPHILIER